MVKREQLKKEIDEISDDYLETLHKIIVALKNTPIASEKPSYPFSKNPLKDSIIFENDIISPIDEAWEVDK